ncbi:scavenger receptor cysteine-rich domain-containing protein DMBT1-like [Babylonia areolata]|uniref:scavenger receptor cysteine-rich domain-containing protein DMBT1-like n=1 Tax=Babylonia areolata TaxID=304850 RepID=UPI003FD362F6
MVCQLSLIWRLSLGEGRASVVVPVDGDLRLTGGSVSRQGRLEVFYQGTWGTVCDDGFGSEEAGVACWQLGYGRHGNNYSTIGVDAGGPPILLDDLQCQGSEGRLEQCQHRAWGLNDCKEEEHVELVCQEDPCRSSPCQNDGKCIALDDTSVRCQCSNVTEGQWCENFIDLCQQHNGGCSHTCINGQGSYQCACPDESLQLNADGHSCYAPTVEVRCGRTMEVAFPRRYWPGLHEQYVTLTNRSCVATGNATHVTISVPLGACGTQSQEVNHGFIFENHVQTRDVPVAGLVSRVRDVSMTVRCHYDDDMLLDNWYIVDSGRIQFTDVSQGHYQLSMDLLHNGQKYVVGNPQEMVEPGEDLSIKLSLSTNDSSLQVFARNCQATPSGQGDASQYLFLDEGRCGNNPSLHHSLTSDAKQETLELQAFQFLSPNSSSSALLMHCDVIICDVTDPDSRCTQGCLTGGSDAGEDDVTMTEELAMTSSE